MDLIYSKSDLTVAALARDGADAVRLDQLDADNVEIANPANRQTAYVSAILSDAGAHVDVAVILRFADGKRAVASPGIQRATATIYTADNDAADYHAPVLAFDLAGAVAYEVRSQDASAGTRTLHTWAA